MAELPEIPESDYSIVFVRSAGPGGQNVNKVASAAQLRFDFAGTALLGERAKARLRHLAGRRLTGDGEIVIIARSHRTQEGNRREALERLQALIAEALIEPKTRRATKPTYGSKMRRVDQKVKHRQTKQLRRRVRDED